MRKLFWRVCHSGGQDCGDSAVTVVERERIFIDARGLVEGSTYSVREDAKKQGGEGTKLSMGVGKLLREMYQRLEQICI